ncbi:hypothetical protein A2331_06725 [Candidatus Falkowbacteria bacterium RIFOXYB2_FULL_34_18]|uniref:Response regulatory domain-containing protein n=1 Tax=Candidatus Falkowbacteria bacterium RIFOXYD2_FULL_34_120 TaxID=1798007 RepID=A0A1F5TRA0_9BACT|nr:MAG: hypothetical protein A2331_06725 [Candidatus Falkowbacteria bacterium RIFOXYB2_FULL_34_18]OGF29985.1 MAG: hypothetical protein A2500_03955 [Candidatus Falkowbacteria bacterium RIFOXYC12_FULL_34_55]OGF37158.1 MAG: hypothetical protein A2466_02565 [Candidatus Falkowbacteria bacterium RIFOXYC2_FULL_34_220]OGF39521.1 MAG: hypothetical protein A2515_04320 [Candidatus Falkowbacteria bacterium RIFOXYD12_FULL_34_57]OGF41496.1 MAG: hypothetical protein A2531_02280 [Candidatus Falkowbacteria bact
MSKVKKVLIVEDEIAMLNALVSKFEKAGFDVLSAQDGKEGVRIAKKESPDLLILDIIMPKMDGISVVKEIRSDNNWGSDVPIIMLSNLSDPESVSSVAKYNVYDFLVKTDWRIDDIINLAKEKLNI